MAFDKFKFIRFTERTASVGTTSKEVYRKLPAVLRVGKKSVSQGGFFNYDLLLDSIANDDLSVHVEQDNDTKEIALYIAAPVFRNQFKSKLSDSLSSQAFQQISKSFFDQIGSAVDNLPGAEKVAILVSPFELGSSADTTDNIIPTATASFDFIHPGIANNSTGKCIGTIINSSTNALYATFKFSSTTHSLNTRQNNATNNLISRGLTHLTRSFDNTNYHHIQAKFIPKWGVEFTPHSSTAAGFTLTASFSSSADIGTLSGSVLLGFNNNSKNYNGLNTNDGMFYYEPCKGFISGEGEFGEGEASASVSFFPVKNLIYYPSNSVVRSGSFKYAPFTSGAAFATGSSVTKEIFYISGSGGPSGSFIPSSNFGSPIHKISGSHIWSNNTLTVPADDGFYYAGEVTVGDHKVYGCFKGEFNFSLNSGLTSSILSVEDGTHVPRFTSSSIHAS